MAARLNHIAAALQSQFAGPALSPLRSISPANNVAAQTATAGGAQLGRACKEQHWVGSGDVAQIVVSLSNWAIGTTGASGAVLPGNSVTYPEMWLTVDGSATGVAVTWSGSASVTLANGATDIQSDVLTPAMFSLTKFTRGTKLWLGWRVEVAAAGQNFVSYDDHNPTTNSSISYQPGAATISNLQGSSALSWSGTVGGINDFASGCPMLLGKFIGGDKPVFAAIGDSICYGVGDSGFDGNAESSFFYRALFDTSSLYANPRAGINFGCPSGVADVWGAASANGGQAKLMTLAKYANKFLERYGINSIVSAGDQSLADTVRAGRKVIWDLVRTINVSGGLAPYVVGLPLTPRTTGTFTTPASGQTVVSGVGQALGLLDADMSTVAGTVNGPDIYLENTTGARANTTKSNVDYWRWSVSPQSTGDGLHPNAAAHTSMAGALRTWMQAQ